MTQNTETQIRTAYANLAPHPTDWVRIADLRTAVNAPRSDIDAALKQLSRTQQATLTPVQDLRTLTAADQAAAIRMGGEDKHLVSIG